MKLSQYFVQTLREAPSDALLPSHQFLVRGGYVRPLSTGIFSLYPMGTRVIRKIEDLMRREMNAINGLEVELPVVQTADLWNESGRYQAIGSEMLRFQDRNQHDMVLAMTHEEAVTDMARSILNSWRQLPFMLYQLQTKYRDEPRARGGLIRVREFTMKDAYSFHATPEDLDEYYDKVHQAYLKIFREVNIEPIVVQSDTGIMGGKVAHEYMLESQFGEDYLILCRKCGYQANAEIAQFARAEVKEELQALEKVATPGKEAVEDVVAFLGTTKDRGMKCVFFSDESGKELVVAVTLGHLEISEVKIKNHLKWSLLVPATPERIAESGMVAGYASPIGAKNCHILVDASVAKSSNLIAGANEAGYHLKNCNVGRDFSPTAIGDFAQADTGCACPHCSAPLEATRGIEIGNIFKLGTKFSESMGAMFLDAEGQRKPAIMGCYGIGVGRLMASVIENNHDQWGPIWPKSIAPFQVEIVTIGREDQVLETAQTLHDQLVQAGMDVLWDDRDERPGVKFKDSDLWGIPVRIAIGAKALVNNQVEWKERTNKDFELVDLSSTLAKIQAYFA
jgi:prolyl-tRNA synthetase